MNINDEDPNDEIRNDADLNRLFAGEVRRGEWKASLDRLGKAQARMWFDASIAVRNSYLAKVDAADQMQGRDVASDVRKQHLASQPQGDGDGRDFDGNQEDKEQG